MTYEEARNAAIRAGALEPQGMAERAASGVLGYNYKNWADTPKAQARLETWTNAILNGVPPHELRQRVG